MELWEGCGTLGEGLVMDGTREGLWSLELGYFWGVWGSGWVVSRGLRKGCDEWSIEEDL